MAYKKRMRPYTKILLSFMLIILLGGTILSMPISTTNGQGTKWVDGIFTAGSAVCVTGLVVNDVSQVYNVFGKSMIMILIQIGGLGVLTISSLFIILVTQKISYHSKKVVQEALNYNKLFDVHQYIKKAVLTVIIIELIGTVLLFMEFIKQYNFRRALFYALFHSISAFCNAGFSLFTLNLETFKNSYIINLTIPSLIILGGLGFATLLNVFSKIRNRKIKLTLNTKVVLFISFFLIIIGTVLTLIIEYKNPDTLGKLSITDKVFASLFQSVSTRTAGFNTIPIGVLAVPTVFLYILLMFIGASPGSTGGGIKTTTFGLVIMGIYGTLTNKTDLEIGKRRISWEVFNRATAIVSIAILYVSLIVFLLTIIEKNMDFLSILFETVSAFATVGLSRGITPNFSDVSKWLIIITMFVGRVGPLTVALFLSASTKKIGNVRYPTENILVG